MRIWDYRPSTVKAESTSRPRKTVRQTGAALALACLLGLGQAVAAGKAFAELPPPSPASEPPAMRQVSGMMMLDYSRLRLSTGGAFDLLGVHYLQNLNDWLYFGVGAIAPIAEGNYGGFFAADATLHAQRRIGRHWFVNAGLAVGAGAGGASVTGIRRISGEGLYARAYAGVGYETRHFSFGVNYARVTILDSPIDDATLNFFVQRRLGFSVGRYADAGRVLGSREFAAPEHENIISFQVNNVSQISPTGSFGGNIGLVSTQFSHFLNSNIYTFFGVDIGYSGLQWYNQAHGGLGGRIALSRHVNLYGQIGLGSGGWVTDTINTGPGFIIYPKVMLEYLWNRGIGATLSAGYLYAPLGTSRNWTVGLGMNYHLSYGHRAGGEAVSGGDYTLRGIRLNVFGRRTSSIFYNGRRTDGLSLIAVQLDYALNEHWYVAGQIAAAANAFRGYAGYAEGFVGLGWQSRPMANGRFQGYAQLLYGLNDVGVDPAHEVGALLYPAVGFNYHLNDRLSIYGQLGATTSLGQYLGTHSNRFETYSVGIGMTYRFSLPTRS